MRVITGIAKGCKLSTPDGLDVRPTLDRVKESLFSILYPYLSDSLVLDLFAGSGSLGIESLSRGALKCVFVEKNKKAYDCVVNNLRYTKLIDKSELNLCSFEDFFIKNTQKFDLVFLDPPYSVGIENEVFPKLLNHLTDGAVVVLESEAPLKQFDGYEVLKNVRYGRVYITLYKPQLGGGN
ncbi:MAG: 16S rRNA (guanine(966)-N(2))-methyltransferase RsmD [Clostridia bacterium]|nr:16S rRNA (guanine(966)-N(2))-methyltransferase RsmD [Clostridia bacterium]